MFSVHQHEKHRSNQIVTASRSEQFLPNQTFKNTTTEPPKIVFRESQFKQHYTKFFLRERVIGWDWMVEITWSSTNTSCYLNHSVWADYTLAKKELDIVLFELWFSENYPWWLSCTVLREPRITDGTAIRIRSLCAPSRQLHHGLHPSVCPSCP